MPSARAGLALRLRVWMHRWSLERRLAEGEDPVASRELALRAGQLTCDESRRKLAAWIERVVDDVYKTPRLTASIDPPRRAVRAARWQLLALANDLQMQAFVRPQGVAAVRRLLSNGGSALYAPEDAEALERAVEDAQRNLLHPRLGA